MPLILVLLALQQAAAPPSMLEQALKTLPGVRLLLPATDLKEYTQADLQKLGSGRRGWLETLIATSGPMLRRSSSGRPRV